MKSLLLTIEFPPQIGGISNYYANLVKYWDNNIVVLCQKQKDDRKFLYFSNKKVYKRKLINNKLPFLKWLPSFYYLYKIIKKEKINFILVGQILPLGTVAWLMSKMFCFDYIVIIHGMDIAYSQKKWWKRYLAKKVIVNSKKIITNSNYVKDIVKKIANKKEIIVVNPGIDYYNLKDKEYKKIINNLKLKYNLQNKKILLSIGRLVKRKGFDLTLKALPKVLKKVQNLVYIIIGDGPDKDRLFKIAQENSIDSVIFLGAISDNEKWALLKLCNIFIMPSRNIDGDFEGFGIVYLEANLVGKPVIAGNSGGVRDIVKHKVNGLLVNPESVDDISEAIIKLAQDENLSKKLGNTGRANAIEKFNWKKQIKKIYQECEYINRIYNTERC